MSIWAQCFVLAALTLTLAGCRTNPARTDSRVLDWSDTTNLVPTTVLNEPYIAPPPTLPALPTPTVPPQAPQKTPVTSTPVETWTPLLRWAKSTGFVTASAISSGAFSGYALRSTNGQVLVRLGSQIAYFDGLDLRLGYAPQVIDGQPYLHSLDLRKTILPLLAGQKALLPATGPIVIDPGHGGENAGTKSVLGEHYEKEYTLDWAFRLQKELTAAGWSVLLTRTTDVDLALSNRVAFAEQHKASAFISLHFNSSAPDQEQAGVETYCLTPAGLPSTLTRGFTDEVGQTFPNNAFDTPNLLLSVGLHRQLLRVNGHRDRGVRRARFPGVLRGQQRPAVLLEGGYLSNVREARQIADAAYRQKLAEAVARAFGRNESALASAATGTAPAAAAPSGN